MKPSFTQNIKQHVEREYESASEARKNGNVRIEFSHLENAHVLGQNSTFFHTKTHCLMWSWAMRHANYRELAGQTFRIIGAATKTVVGLVPEGNTGGSNVSPFRVMDITPEHAKLIREARGGV